MSQFSHESVDSDPESGYVVTVIKEGAIQAFFVATTYDIAEELSEFILNDDEECELDGCGIHPIKFDTLNQFNTVH